MAESEFCATLTPPPLWAALPAPGAAARPQGAAGNAPWPAGQAGAQARPPQPQPSCWPLGLAAKWGAIALSLCLPAPHPARAPTPPPTTGTTQPWATRGTRLGHATPPGCTNTPTSATSAAAWPFAGGATLAWGPLVVRCTKPRRAGQAPVPPPPRPSRHIGNAHVCAPKPPTGVLGGRGGLVPKVALWPLLGVPPGWQTGWLWASG